MHRQQTPPDAPPVVPPPLPEEVAPPPAAHESAPVRSFLQRLVRDVKFGGTCLAIGLVLGHFGLPGRLWTPLSSDPTPLAMQPHADDAAARDAAVADSEPTISLAQSNVAEVPDQDDQQQVADAVVVAMEEPAATPVLKLVELPEEAVSDAGARPDLPDRSEESTIDESSIAQQDPSGDDAEKPAATLVRSRSQSLQPSLQPIASILSTAVTSSTAHPQCEDGTCDEMQSLGTVLKWADSPADAYQVAEQQDKLVFMIHVSGNFEIPGFT